MSVREQCAKCLHWDWPNNRCLRIVKVKVIIGNKTGSVDIETLPGVIPKEQEDRLTQFLAESIPYLIDSWRGWKEIDLHMECPAREESHKLDGFCNVVPFKQ